MRRSANRWRNGNARAKCSEWWLAKLEHLRAGFQELRRRYAFLGKDEDLDRGNQGMTLVELPADTSRIFTSKNR